MSEVCFQRVRIGCNDVAKAALDYSALLGGQPVWKGRYSVRNPSGQELDRGRSVLFTLANIAIELFDSHSRPLETGICSVAIQKDQTGLTENFKDKLIERCYTYTCNDNVVQEQIHYILPTDQNSNYELSIMDDLRRAHVQRFESDRVSKVDHLVLRACDQQVIDARFGSKGLNLRLALDQYVPKWGGRMLFYRDGRMTLEVIIPDNNSEQLDFLWGIAYRTENIDACRSRLINLGVDVSRVRDGRKPGTRVATVKSKALGIPTLLIAEN